MPGFAFGRHENRSVEVNNQGTGALLSNLRRPNLRRLRPYAEKGQERFAAPMPGRWLSHSRRQTVELRLRAFNSVPDAKLKNPDMAQTNSFRFVDPELNRDLIALLKKSGIRHLVDQRGVIRYSPQDEERVENDLISTIRGRKFPAWQIATCPSNWTEVYRSYMQERSIPFVEEIMDGDVWFLIPRRYRPHAWKLKEPSAAETRAG